MASVEERVRTFIAENFVMGDDAATLKNDDSLMDQGIVDSTGVLELIAFLEEDFDVQVADEEIVPENLDTIDNLCAFIQKKKG